MVDQLQRKAEDKSEPWVIADQIQQRCMLEKGFVSLWTAPYPINPIKQSILPAGSSTQELGWTTCLHRSHRLHGSHSHQGIYHCKVSVLYQSQGRKNRNWRPMRQDNINQLQLPQSC